MRIRSQAKHVMLLAGILAGSIFPLQAMSAETTDVTSSTAMARHPRAATLMKRRWGIEVLEVRLASAGYMIEFRYRVLDAKKARPLFDRKIKPYLEDKASGAKVIVPSPEKVGQLRNVHDPEPGKSYWMLFANPGKLVKRGNEVNVVIGEFRVDSLIVN